jgi:hypothetical protein
VLVPPAVFDAVDDEPAPEELVDPPPPHPATSRAKSATSASRAMGFEFKVLIIDASDIDRIAAVDERHHDDAWRSTMMSSCVPR